MARRRPDFFWAIAILVIVLAGWAAYSDSLGGPFVYDDIPSVLENSSIRQLWPPGPLFALGHGSGYTHEGRPILNISLAINYAIGDTTVTGYHLLNLLIHLGTALALFGITRRTLKTGCFREAPLARGSNPTWFALAVTTLWMLHPLQTEAVTYVVQRAESLMGLFYLLTIYGLVRYASADGRRWAIFSVVACLLGAGTKEVIVTAPVLAFLFDRTFLAGGFRQAWSARQTYYLCLAGMWLPLIGLILANGGNRNGSSGFGAGISWVGYALTQPEALVRYLSLSLWPHPLVFDYGAYQTSLTAALPYALVILALGVGTVYALVRAPVIGFLGFWFFGILAVTSLVPGSTEMIAERRMYLPVAALAVLVVLTLAHYARDAAFGIAFTLATVLGLITWTRNLDYQSDVTLWKDSLAHRPKNSRGQYNLGVAYFNRHDNADEITAYREAIRLDPHNMRASHGLANALLRQGDVLGSLPYYRAALSLDGQDAKTHFDFGTALATAGRPEQAIAEYRQALALNPSLAEAHDNYGIALAQTAHLSEAEDEFKRALRIDPRLATAHANLGGVYATQARFADAENEFRSALGLQPTLIRAQTSLGDILSQEGHYAQAIPWYQAALATAPHDLNVQENLGVAFLESGNFNSAIPLLAQVVAARPNSPAAHHNLAAALAAAGRTVEARAELQIESSLPRS